MTEGLRSAAPWWSILESQYLDWSHKAPLPSPALPVCTESPVDHRKACVSVLMFVILLRFLSAIIFLLLSL